eukprot:TRINITY_DN6300_c0_g1_i1.p1 TRINITY_DN6300_c0_g1~~TRINITY_DN6300_c0_g1_i1.p1  ORF type:complete len:117 (+),score=23.55 TRINITY_DN6300_c0_g1_i1:192-542(+)
MACFSMMLAILGHLINTARAQSTPVIASVICIPADRVLAVDGCSWCVCPSSGKSADAQVCSSTACPSAIRDKYAQDDDDDDDDGYSDEQDEYDNDEEVDDYAEEYSDGVGRRPEIV